MATIAAIKAVLLDKEKRTLAELNKKDTTNILKPSSTSSSSKVIRLPVSASAATTSKKSSSSAQSLAEAITNARKASSTSKSTTVKRSPAKKSSKIVVETPEVTLAFTDHQVKRLTKEFAKKNILTKQETRALAAEVRLGEEQVRAWFANRRRTKVRSNISRQEKSEAGVKSHGLKSVEVSALLPMADIMSMSRNESEPEVVDILDDSLESDDDDISLLEVSKVVEITPKSIQEKVPSTTKSNPQKVAQVLSTTKPGQEKVLKVSTPKSSKEKTTIKPSTKPSKVVANNKGNVKEAKKEKEAPIEKVIKPEPKNSKPCTREEDLVEELLRRIEELEEDLKDKDGDLYYTKKDLESVQATLEGKERVLNTVQESIPKVVSEHKKALQTKDDAISELELSNSKLREELKVQPKSELTDVEVEKLKEANIKLENKKDCIEVEFVDKLKAKEEENDRLKLSINELKREIVKKEQLQESQVQINGEIKQLKQKNEDDIEKIKQKNEEQIKQFNQKNENEIKELKQKNEDEINQLKQTIEKSEKRIGQVLRDIGEKDDEIKILKYKERQACDYQTSVEETKRLLEENRKDTLALKDYERKLTRKISSLEFDLYTKTAESGTQALIISRLNEKIQQQQIVKICDVDEDIDAKYEKVLDEGLPALEDIVTEEEDDPESEADQSIIQGVPQSSPYVVNTSAKKRKRKDDSTATSDDELDYSEDTPEEPEFESLCAEIETLCVPSKRPRPTFSTQTDCKKMKVADDILDIDIDTAESVESFDNNVIGRFVIETLLDRIFES